VRCVSRAGNCFNLSFWGRKFGHRRGKRGVLHYPLCKTTIHAGQEGKLIHFFCVTKVTQQEEARAVAGKKLARGSHGDEKTGGQQ